MKISKVTPIQIVDQIEPALAFWTEQLGFEKQVDVKHDGRLGFVLLTLGKQEVMLQTRASLEADLGKKVASGMQSVVYMDVDSLDEAIKATKGFAVVVPERRTAYGAREIFVRDANGVVIGFAEHVA